MNETHFLLSAVSNIRTKWETPFHMACKKGQLDVVEGIMTNQFKAFNLNTRDVNGMTHFDFFTNYNRILMPPIFSPITIEY